MDIDRSVAQTGSESAEPKRSWISPAVQDMGSLRHLTLQGPSFGGECNPLENPACP